MTIEWARDELGLQCPVILKVTDDIGKISGSSEDHQFGGSHAFDSKGRHLIRIKPWVSKYDNSLIWHELRHAQQCEEMGSEQFSREYNALLALWGYYNHPMEEDARAFQETKKHWVIRV